MWCFPCLKPSTKDDPNEDPSGPVPWHEKRRLEDEQLAWALGESLNQQEFTHCREQEERRRIREDEQLAHAFLDEEMRRQFDNKSASNDDGDQQLAKALEESFKEEEKRKHSEEQVKKDKEYAVTVQESLNMVDSPPLRAESRCAPLRAPLDEYEQLAKVLEESLKEKEKGEQVKKDQQFAVALQKSLNTVEPPPRFAENENISTNALLDEDVELAQALEESLKDKGKENENISTRAPLDEDVELAQALEESLKDKGKGKQPKDEDEKLPDVNPPPRRLCGGCNSEIEQGNSADVLGVPWHPECLQCDACHRKIAIQEVDNHVSNSRGNFHKSCYERYCYVCKGKVRNFGKHPFWKELYCLSHEADGTPKCCSCERLEPSGTEYVMLGDRRWLCLECMESAVMDTDEGQPLHFEIREYFEGLHMKIDKEFPFLLVEKTALNQAEKEEKIGYQYEVTRGICLSEAQTIRMVSERPKMGPNKQLIDIRTEPQEVVRTCEVTAVLILYGFPRVLTGYILAHEMMHAYLRLSGHKVINHVLEEGICQVLGHMWLESQRYAPVEDEASSSASVSSSRTPADACASKKGKCSDFEKKMVEFCKNQIETDDSPIYGRGFKKVNEMVTGTNLQATLKAIIRKVPDSKMS